MLLHGGFLPVNVDTVVFLANVPFWLVSMYVCICLLICSTISKKPINVSFLEKGILSQPFKDSSTIHGSKSTALTWQKLLKNHSSSSSSLIRALRKKMWWPLIFLLFSTFLWSFISLNLKLFLFLLDSPSPFSRVDVRERASDSNGQGDPKGHYCDRSISY